ncbi:MAG TPA: hypothetical protein DCY97_00645 [Marinilabiliales bacterium]|nr:hypothetical protein [Marinilabiliales bacterium]
MACSAYIWACNKPTITAPKNTNLLPVTYPVQYPAFCLFLPKIITGEQTGDKQGTKTGYKTAPKNNV